MDNLWKDTYKMLNGSPQRLYSGILVVFLCLLDHEASGEHSLLHIPGDSTLQNPESLGCVLVAYQKTCLAALFG